MSEGSSTILTYTVEGNRGLLEIITHQSTQTQQLGEMLGTLLCGGELILLDGHLGAGKTTFTQGLAKGMRIPDVVSSPTFTLLKEYKAADRRNGLALYHFDLYRLDDPEEIVDLGFEEYFYSNGVCVVEWADRAADIWPSEHLMVRLSTLSTEQRRLSFEAEGAYYCTLLQKLRQNVYVTTGS